MQMIANPYDALQIEGNYFVIQDEGEGEGDGAGGVLHGGLGSAHQEVDGLGARG